MPNIVLILTDDQRWDTLSYMPTIRDQLQAQGLTFSQAFTTTPLCCPSRSSILTGLYTHNHRVLHNTPPEGGFPKFQDASTLAVWLQQAGYRTALMGKYLNAYKRPTYVPPGWDEWDSFTKVGYYNYQLSQNGVAVGYGNQPADYSTDVLAAKALEFVQSSLDQSQPFFLYFAPYAPHGPFTPAPRHKGFFASLPPWRPPSFNEVDISDKPAWLQGQVLDVPRNDGIRIQQLETLLAVDEAVNQLIQVVKSHDQMNQTLWVYTSDNGFFWGEHRRQDKRAAYEEAIRIPMVLSYPPLITSPGQTAEIALNIDLAPTIAAVAGIPVPYTPNGSSLLPLLMGGSLGRTEQLIEYWQDIGTVPTYQGIRTPQYKYIKYITGEEELYEFKTDPYELANRIADPTLNAQLNELRNRLDRLANS